MGASKGQIGEYATVTPYLQSVAHQTKVCFNLTTEVAAAPPFLIEQMEQFTRTITIQKNIHIIINCKWGI